MNISIKAIYTVATIMFCPVTNDGYLTWPKSPANKIVRQPCPLGWYGVEASKFVSRTCMHNGSWSSASYYDCLTSQMQSEFQKMFSKVKMTEQKLLYRMMFAIRIVELFCLVISAISILAALVIFKETLFHNPMQVLIRIATYILQVCTQSDYDGMKISARLGIFCELLIVLLQYSATVTFMWILAEGIYLYHSLTTLRRAITIWHLSLAAWFIPVPIAIVWAVMTWWSLGTARCWPSYQSIPCFWILRSFRLLIMLINFVFLLIAVFYSVRQRQYLQSQHCIGGDAMMKTRKSFSNLKRISDIFVATRNTIFLLPMLGLINTVEEFSLSRGKCGTWGFMIFILIRHVLVDIQGFLVSMLYCFCNPKIRTILAMKLNKRRNKPSNSNVYTNKFSI